MVLALVLVLLLPLTPERAQWNDRGALRLVKPVFRANKASTNNGAANAGADCYCGAPFKVFSLQDPCC